MVSGFACPSCGGDHTQVRDSRPRVEGGNRRRRMCVTCQHRFTTWEIEVGDAADILSFAASGKTAVVKQAQELISKFGDLDADDRAVIIGLVRRLTGDGSAPKRIDRLPGERLDA